MRPTILRTSVAALILLVTLAPAPATAHNSEFRYGQTVYNDGNFCVQGSGVQNHGYSSYRTVTTWNNCVHVAARNPGYIRNRAEYYADGRYCAYVGESWNTTTTWELAVFINQDVWHLGCNNGAGVNVWITMDTWNWAAYGYYWYPYYGGGGIRPITGHCHCP